MFRGYAKVMAKALVIGIIAHAVPGHCDESDHPSFEQVALKLQKWKESFVNLHIVYELRSLPRTDVAISDWAAPPNPESAPVFFEGEWIWADHGLDLFDHKFFYRKPGSVGSRTADVFNGPKGFVYRANYRKQGEGKEQFTELELHAAGNGKGTSIKARTPVEGLYWSAKGVWLTELFREWSWTLEGVEDVQGSSCAKIKTSHPQMPDFVEIMWLDLAHDCLPRRILRPTIPDRRAGQDFIVDGFQQLDNGSWFPKRGRLQMPDGPNQFQNQFWIVTVAEMNRPLDMSRFEPPAPSNGTLVTDTRTGKSYRHGGPTVATPQSTASSSSLPNTPSGIPLTGEQWRWSKALICAALALISLGIGVHLRRTRTKKEE